MVDIIWRTLKAFVGWVLNFQILTIYLNDWNFIQVINPKTLNMFMKENKKTENFNLDKWGKLPYLDKIIFNFQCGYLRIDIYA